MNVSRYKTTKKKIHFRNSWRLMTTATENAKTEGETKSAEEGEASASADQAKLAEMEKLFAEEKDKLKKEIADYKVP